MSCRGPSGQRQTWLGLGLGSGSGSGLGSGSGSGLRLGIGLGPGPDLNEVVCHHGESDDHRLAHLRRCVAVVRGGGKSAVVSPKPMTQDWLCPRLRCCCYHLLTLTLTATPTPTPTPNPNHFVWLHVRLAWLHSLRRTSRPLGLGFGLGLGVPLGR